MLATNVNYKKLSDLELLNPSYQKQLITFLYQSLEQYRDTESDIKACLDYILTPHKGGHVFLAESENKKIEGVVFLANTNMGQFVPEYLLVYIAINPKQRGKGIGRQLLSFVQNYVKAPIALHVEHDNPATHLYERLGFSSKYKEMRWYPNGQDLPLSR